MEAITTTKQYIILKTQLHNVTQSHGKRERIGSRTNKEISNQHFLPSQKGTALFVCFKYIIMTVETFEIEKKQQQHRFQPASASQAEINAFFTSILQKKY